ncbi:MFS transporter [Haloarchaeobius sp. HME9146]|uniref:MFS transporter n=1 Tax=Haloarchaeobius sp. HME9146 TaxID=2978732 RepID=UPI0021C11156|nr:MFS transporter [Haloarchaeobius sp. HME9146]MCT9098290.1 MFS transporter [Haloarchaeobius sp. HME9146]
MTDRWLYSWALGSVAFGGASLLIPLYIVQLGASPVELGVLAATAAVIGAPGAILFGKLANRVGHRRPLVLSTLSIVALALAVVPLVTSIAAVIVANAALWLFVASIAPVVTMLVVDDSPESAWSERIGQLNKYQGYGWAGGLVLGTVWPFVGAQLVGATAVTRVLFWLLAACAAASVLGAARSLPRPTEEDHVTSDREVRKVARLLSSSRRGIKGATFAFSPNRLYWTMQSFHPQRLRGRLNPALVTYLAAAVFFFTGSAAFWAPLPLFFTELNFDSGQVFALYLASSLGSAVLYERAGQFAGKLDIRLLQSGALAARGLLFPAVALITGIGGVTYGLGVSGVGLAAIGATWAFIAVVGTAIVTRLAPPAIRGEILGVHTALGAVSGGIGGVLGGWAATVGYLFAFGVAGGLVLLGAGLVVSLRALSGGEDATRTPDNAAGDRPDAVAVPASEREHRSVDAE